MSKNTYIKIPVDKELLQQVEAIAKHDSRSVNQTALSLICKGLEKITKEKAEKSK